jgi:hypothetical protein
VDDLHAAQLVHQAIEMANIDGSTGGTHP